MNDALDVLDRLARRLAEYGWIVRLDPTPPVHLVVRPSAGPPPSHGGQDGQDAEYLLACAARTRLLRVWAPTAAAGRPLGSVVDADEAHVLLRQHVAARAAATDPLPAGTVREWARSA